MSLITRYTLVSPEVVRQLDEIVVLRPFQLFCPSYLLLSLTVRAEEIPDGFSSRWQKGSNG